MLVRMTLFSWTNFQVDMHSARYVCPVTHRSNRQ